MMEEIDKQKTARKQQSLRRRFEAKALIIELKKKPCADCKNEFKHYQMDFVSKDNDESSRLKIKDLLNRSTKRIIEEIEKRDLVCANCSRTRSWIRQRKMRMGPT